jgi:hypothetical protein
MSQPSLAKFVMKRPGLHRLLAPVAEWYKNAAGYRQLGLKYVIDATAQRMRCVQKVNWAQTDCGRVLGPTI